MAPCSRLHHHPLPHPIPSPLPRTTAHPFPLTLTPHFPIPSPHPTHTPTPPPPRSPSPAQFPATTHDPHRYLQAAEEAACFIQSHLYDKDSKMLARSYRTRKAGRGFADDYAQMVGGLLDMYEVRRGGWW